jgi:LuxR family maltose regulon positive regulatory protein
VLDAELHAALASARNRRALSLKVLRALALQRTGDAAAALDEIGEVLQTASQEGFMRLIVDEGAAVATLVHRYAAAQHDGSRGNPSGTSGASSSNGTGGTSDPILADYLQRLLQAMGPAPASAGEVEAPVADAMQEPLTRKEIRVLQLLAEGYSNSAMAEKLFVSDSTVRTHLRNINMKLDAKSRTQAVAIARKLGVIR